MYALRNLARSAPRSAARFSTKAIRMQPSLLRQVAIYQPWTKTVPTLTSSFSTSAWRSQDSELIAKLQNEISLEEDMKDDEDLSQNIKEYLENSAFEIEDKAGHQEITLKRKYNDETIRVTFTTADLNNDVPSEDEGVYENDVDDLTYREGQSGGASTKGTINQGTTQDGNVRVAPEDRVAPADREELDDEYDEEGQQGYPARASIRIERPGKGALAIEAVAQDGDFMIQDLFYYPDAAFADPQTAEKDWARRTLYAGPPFGNLDEDLQILLEKYLEERGINTRMALFIPDYIDHKEQKEYVRWLNNLKSFVE
ncbi:mitochondrial glyco protein [Lojkania enalia]|uniref:Mitochondrial glyco protein n=1 Tax=Lojkania enalia TaxID=147567 RepID=A0A9P4K443_9PLEO|nr:mitochondrial glyco protein [Didymosphaeria enalia]